MGGGGDLRLPREGGGGINSGGGGEGPSGKVLDAADDCGGGCGELSSRVLDNGEGGLCNRGRAIPAFAQELDDVLELFYR